MTKVYLKSHEKAQAILDFLEANPLSSAKRIAEDLQLGLSTVYNTIDEWLEQFPFFSRSTLERTISSLVKVLLKLYGNS